MAYCTVAELRRRTAGGSGSGGTVTVNSLSDAEALALIEQASRMFDLVCGVTPNYFDPAYHPVWESGHVYVVGDIVTPTTRNSHKYRVTTVGTSGASEPVFPTSSAATVTSGTVVFTENGADVVAATKTIYGNGLSYLKLPPYVSGTLTLTVPTTYTTPTFIERDGYLVLTTTDGIAPPFPAYIWPSGWYTGVAITISAIWGYAETPADVKMAVIELAINLFRETDPAAIRLVNIEGIAIRESLPPRVKEVSRRYRVKEGVAFA